MIERVFDLVRPIPTAPPSVLEELLRGWTAVRAPLRVELFSPGPGPVFDGESHASREPAVEPEMRAFAGLLEAGAGHLTRAKAAHLAQCRSAAVQARALAAFAAARPAAALDRPEVEATAAASRAAALTEVSEWAVDEVMCALGLPSPAASAPLAPATAPTTTSPPHGNRHHPDQAGSPSGNGFSAAHPDPATNPHPSEASGGVPALCAPDGVRKSVRHDDRVIDRSGGLRA
jgi:hypothetical protein